MQKLLLALFGFAVLGISIYLGAQPGTDRLKIRLRLVDVASGKTIAGMVRVTDADKKTVDLPGLFDRMTGLTKDLPNVHWYIVPADGISTTLPRGKLQLEV